jgi:homoserine O-acetyltransferase
MRAGFPRYDYDDMVRAQYLLITQGLGVRHLRLVIGNSMGGMQAWLWGEYYPRAMDALVPMASVPAQMSGRNWLMRRMIVDAIRNDPGWDNGNYTTQPTAIRAAAVYFGIVSSGGTQAYQALAPTREAADKLLDDRLAAPFTADANDYLYQWDASRDYNPEPALGQIVAPVLAINSADDERNPPETGLMAAGLQRVASGRLYLIPASAQTRGHATTGYARFWSAQLQAFLEAVPR